MEAKIIQTHTSISSSYQLNICWGDVVLIIVGVLILLCIHVYVRFTSCKILSSFLMLSLINSQSLSRNFPLTLTEKAIIQHSCQKSYIPYRINVKKYVFCGMKYVEKCIFMEWKYFINFTFILNRISQKHNPTFFLTSIKLFWKRFVNNFMKVLKLRTFIKAFYLKTNWSIN